MEEVPFDLPGETASVAIAENLPLEEPLLTASEPFVGRWTRLISTTNWEKGRIITQWRDALQASAAPVTAYSDETWSRLVGGVTGQHIGRLRRVFQRFGATYADYKGLYWSHFFAASDWTDGEMWLEGAVQNTWSVSQMRNQRWETLGKLEADQPRAEDEVAAERDEDIDASPAREKLSPDLKATYDEVQGPRHEGPDFGDDSAPGDDTAYTSFTAGEETTPVELVRAFAGLPDLPGDLADAFDQFKIALLHHKANEWKEISCDDALKVIDALKAMITAPSQA